MTHEPVPGAVVDVGSRSRFESFSTHEDGAFEARIRTVAFDERFDIAVAAKHYCRIRRTWSREELKGSLPLEIALPRTAGVEGVLRDSDGEPVAHFPLIVAPDPSVTIDMGLMASGPAALQALLCPWSLDPSSSWSGITQTDASGRFAVDDLVPWMPACRVNWVPSGSCYPVPVCGLAGRTLGGPGEWTHVELTENVTKVNNVLGRLLLNGQPISGEISWKGPTQSGFAKAGPDGRFHLHAVETGEVTISTLRSTGDENRLGYAKSYSIEVGEEPPVLRSTVDPCQSGLAKSPSIEITAESTIERDFDLEVPMSSISGHVRTVKGAPVPYPRVWLDVPDGSGACYRISTKTGPAGAWSIAVPASSAPCTVYLTDGPVTVRREAVAPGSVDVDLVKPEVVRSVLRVRAVDSVTGKPVQDPWIEWRRTGTVSENPLPIVGANSDEALTARGLGRHPWVHGTMSVNGTYPASKADEAGWFTFECPAGSIDLFVQAGGGYLSVLRRDVDVGEVDEPRRIEVPLERGVNVALGLAPDSGPLPDEGLWIEILDEDDVHALRGPDRSARSITRDESYDVLGRTFDERNLRLGPGSAVRAGRLRQGHYRLAILDQAGTLEPDAIDVKKEGELFEIRWTPK